MMDMNTLLMAQGAAPAGNQTPADQAAREKQAEATGQKFEAMFLAQMLAPMFDGLGADSPFGGQTAKAYRSVMLQEYGEAMAANGGVGIADQVKAEILKLQEVAQ
ncbi:rod-binding protein [Algihabitans albus]|uniref:rod-binding protein n=1 Tax=Algihabitans albus TaxID=2164067 RepID=UPI000E5D3EEC|nr:rod-binding protein [Algihabitans albus]